MPGSSMTETEVSIHVVRSVFLLSALFFASLLLSTAPFASAARANGTHTDWFWGDYPSDTCEELHDDNACKYAGSRIHYDPGGYVFGIHAEGGTDCDHQTYNSWGVSHGDPEEYPDRTAAYLANFDTGHVFWSRGRTYFQDNCDIRNGTRHTFVTDQSVNMHDDIRAVIWYWHRDSVASNQWMSTEVHVRL